MKISIIIPVLNEGHHIVLMLEQLKASQSGDYEIIIVDGGSRDNCLELAHGHADRVIVAPQGRALQMNAGADCASGDVLLFLHADTSLPEHALELLRAAKYSWGRFDVRLTGQGFIFRLIAYMMNQRSRLTSVVSGDQALFVARDLFQQVGGFPEIALMEDIALSKILRKHSKPLCLRQQVITSSRRWQQRGVYKTILLMWWLRILYFFGTSPARLAKMYR